MVVHDQAIRHTPHTHTHGGLHLATDAAVFDGVWLFDGVRLVDTVLFCDDVLFGDDVFVSLAGLRIFISCSSPFSITQ